MSEENDGDPEQPRNPENTALPMLSAARRAQIVRQSLSVGVATGAYGLSFGALSVAAGLSIVQTCSLSLLLFSGGSQYAFIGIIGGGGSSAAAIATSTLLGLRNGLYGLQLTRLLSLRGPRRLVGAQLTIDESTAVAIGQPEIRGSRLGFWLTGASVFVLWNLMTLIGAVVGNALGDPKRYGLDAAAASAFLALLWPRLKAGEARVVAVAAAFVAIILSPLVPAGVPVLAAGLTAVAAGWWGGRAAAAPAPAGPGGLAGGAG
jgi:predicted branched-subunit amino acid permease